MLAAEHWARVPRVVLHLAYSGDQAIRKEKEEERREKRREGGGRLSGLRGGKS